MMKKRLLSLMCAALLVLGLVPSMALAADPISTDVVIHKMQVDTGTGLEDHDGNEISDFTGTNLEGATAMEGIVFKYWSISATATAAQMAEIAGLSTITQIEAYATANPTVLTGGTTLAATNADGQVSVTGLAEGKYLFGEVNGADHNVSEYVGVPFLLELPAMKTDGSGYFGTGANALHVYPKNVKKAAGLDVETVNESGSRIGGSAYHVEKLDPNDSTYKKVTTIGNNGEITLSDGSITLADLPAGSYRLVNCTAPAGHVLDNRPLLFSVASGIVTFTATGNNPKARFTPESAPDNPMITHEFGLKPDVGKTEGSGGSERVGGTVTWTVEMGVPTDIKSYTKYVMTDTIDTRLDFLGLDQISVKTKTGGATLTSGTHYNATYVGKLLTITFVPSTLETFEGDTLVVTYNTKINETAIMGEEIPNDVELSFDNNNGHITEPGEVVPTIPPTVWTGGAQFKKVDGSNTTVVLEGAEFKISSDAAGTQFLKWTQDLMDANTLSKFVNPAVGADIVLKSGADGIFEIKGLKGGTYYLVETKAPTIGGKQYNLLRDPAAFEITKTSYETVNQKSVENNSGLQIPQTGGIGTVIFTIVGVALMGVAIMMFRRKKNNSHSSND